MKNILILRHAKSDWGNPSLSDFDRPLSARGLKDAPRMGSVLMKLGCMPDLVVSSPSMRTRQTVALSVLEKGYSGPVRWDETLYGGTFHDFLQIIRSLPERIERPLLVGHNPGVEDTLALLLTRQEGGIHGSSSIRVPTAGLAYLDADLYSWDALKPGSCVLRWFLIPKLVKTVASKH
jgi:phosphohistidine phosphatase